MKFYTTSKISENIHETPEGYLVCIGVSIARTGEMIYGPGETPLEAGEDGKVIVTRDAAEVFRPETMASFEGKAVTIGHPSEFVSPENWSTLSKGIIQNVRRGKGDQENDLIADLLVTESGAIALVKNGLREVSCGYEAGYTQTGLGRGAQSEIIGNHLALVDEGRAGSSYAINDHKGKGLRMKLGDKIKAIFAKAQDEALKVATEDSVNTETPETKEGFVTMKDMKGYFDGKFEAMMGGKKEEQKDATTTPTENEPAKVVAKDDEVAPGLEGRLKKLEDMVAKWMSSQAGDAEEGEEMEDADSEEGEESEDDDFAESTMVGDTAARVEILAPGMNPKEKDVKRKALLAAYATKDGKAAIDIFTAGKSPDLKLDTTVGLLFLGASEGLKATRSSDLAKTKTHDFKSNLGQPKGAMTAEQMNELNAKHYVNK